MNKEKIELQTYKIMLLLKDVDPKYPIDELSTILRNSKLNFEIEKIERYLEQKIKISDWFNLKNPDPGSPAVVVVENV